MIYLLTVRSHTRQHMPCMPKTTWVLVVQLLLLLLTTSTPGALGWRFRRAGGVVLFVHPPTTSSLAPHEPPATTPHPLEHTPLPHLLATLAFAFLGLGFRFYPFRLSTSPPPLRFLPERCFFS
jgi:hypothetical protein